MLYSANPLKYSVESPQAQSRGQVSTPIHVVIVDDHVIMRQGLRSVLEQFGGFEIVGEAADGMEALEVVGKIEPDLVLMDINMPRLNGIEATRLISNMGIKAKVVGLSMQASQQAREAMSRAGAAAYLDKACPVEELCQTLREVYNQSKDLDP